jgi:DNA-directed RNA polymerase
MGLITEIASDPLKNREWLTYEDCWQALGAII